jgi:hypothetical protein
MGETRNAFRILVGKSVVKYPLGNATRRWEGNRLCRWGGEGTGSGSCSLVEFYIRGVRSSNFIAIVFVM